MKNTLAVLLLLSLPSFAKTHESTIPAPCARVWSAVKDVLINSGKYRVESIDNEDMLASYGMGGWVAGTRTNSVVLKPQGTDACDMEIQTRYSGVAHNDAGDFRKRVEESLANEHVH